MRLYSENNSPFSAPVRVSIYAKGLEIEIEPPPGGLLSARFHAINPLGTIPCLMLDSGEPLPESAAILEYLEDKFPNPPLRPEGAEARALCGFCSVSPSCRSRRRLSNWRDSTATPRPIRRFPPG
jgi:glutathione S-transferase